MKKSSQPTISALELVEKNMHDIATFDAELQSINARMDTEIHDIRKKYYENITSLQKQKDVACTELERLALSNQDLLFSIKRSFATKFGSFGFRTGKPKFRLSEQVTWDHIKNYLKQVMPQYLRVTTEVQKDKLMSDRHLPELAERFSAMGLAVVQDESFYIDIKKEK